jgi:hypothetical protein
MFPRGLKPCPFNTARYSAACEVVPFHNIDLIQRFPSWSWTEATGRVAYLKFVTI